METPGLQVASCFSTNTLQVNNRGVGKRCHYFSHTSLACPSATSTSQWVIVPITPHFLSGEGFCLAVAAPAPVSSSLTQRSLWPNGGEGVFMAMSGPFSRSGATQDSLWGPYYKCLTQILRDTHGHISAVTHIAHLAKTLGFCTLPPP